MSIEVGNRKGEMNVHGKGTREKHFKVHQESGGFAKYYSKVCNRGQESSSSMF